MIVSWEKGCWTYEDIRTYNDKEYDTYHATTDAMSILKDDNYLFKYMDEAVERETS